MSEHIGLNKLEGFGPIYVTSLERSSDRKQYIAEHFSKYGISDYTFIDGIDGSKDDLSKIVNNLDKISITKNELSCGLSHFKAIQHWLDTSDSEYAIFMEDDVSLETVDFWDFTWQDFIKAVDKKYDILQLAITNNFIVNPRLHLREYLDWCSAAFLVKREYAKKLVNKHKVDGKYNISSNRLLSVAEVLLFGGAICYSIPLFTYTTQFDSTINSDHVSTLHALSREQTMSYWKNNSMFKLDLL